MAVKQGGLDVRSVTLSDILAAFPNMTLQEYAAVLRGLQNESGVPLPIVPVIRRGWDRSEWSQLIRSGRGYAASVFVGAGAAGQFSAAALRNDLTDGSRFLIFGIQVAIGTAGGVVGAGLQLGAGNPPAPASPVGGTQQNPINLFDGAAHPELNFKWNSALAATPPAARLIQFSIATANQSQLVPTVGGTALIAEVPPGAEFDIWNGTAASFLTVNVQFAVVPADYPR